VAQERPPELAHDFDRELRAGHNSADLGADVATNLPNFDVLVVRFL
jgi:hypothetical protein